MYVCVTYIYIYVNDELFRLLGWLYFSCTHTNCEYIFHATCIFSIIEHTGCLRFTFKYLFFDKSLLLKYTVHM